MRITFWVRSSNDCHSSDLGTPSSSSAQSSACRARARRSQGAALDLRRSRVRRFVTVSIPVRTLESILLDHGSVLLIDASSSPLHGGWLVQGETARWATVDQEAGTGLYLLLAELDISPNQAGAFLFCEGPGSMLGIRTVAAALRVWCALQARPVYRYLSLDLLAHAQGGPGRTFICDARRRSWHALTIDEGGAFSPIRRLATQELPAGEVYMPEGFRSWTQLPTPAPKRIPYDPALLSHKLAQVPCFQLTEDPDAYQPERPAYAKWTPQVHQAPPA